VETVQQNNNSTVRKCKTTESITKHITKCSTTKRQYWAEKYKTYV